MAELHGDLFSRHASPLEVYVFVVVDEKGEHVMSDEICRRCNGKQQGRRRGGRIVQLPNSFMVLHSCSRHTRTRTYYTYDQIYSAGEKETPSEIRSRDRHVLQVSVQKFRVYLLNRNRVDIKFWCGKHVYLREMLYRKTCLEYLQSLRSEKNENNTW